MSASTSAIGVGALFGPHGIVSERRPVGRSRQPQDSSELAAEEKLRAHVVNELDHRLRNKSMTTQAVLSYALKDHPDLHSAVIGRLHALSKTDELITAAQGKGAALKEVLNIELSPYDMYRVQLDGPPLWLPPKITLIFALLVHELATNASKYGALSTPTGKVVVTWQERYGRLIFNWRESGGPEVKPPERSGFGTRLLTGIFSNYNGHAEVRFLPSGVECDVSLALNSWEGTAPSDESRI
jgi:two-component sensor histidine kinase